jgi:drug/metabolite transporter (DMT)-like permease
VGSRPDALISSTPVTDSQRPAGPPGVAVVAFAITVFLGGTNAVAVKQTVQELAPLWGAGLRFAAAGLLMVIIVLITARRFGRGRTLGGAALYGLLGFAASYGLLYTGIQDVPAGTVMVLVALTPLFTFGLALLHRQEKFRIQGLVGALVAVAGVAIVFIDQVQADVPIGSMLLVLLAAVAIAESGVVAKSIPDSDPFATNAVAMIAGAVVLVVLALVASEPLTIPQTTTTWLATGYLVVFGSVVMFALYLFTLQRWTASAVSYVTLLMPLVTVVIAAIAFDERISPSFVVGSLVVLAGVYIGAFFTRPPRRVPSSSLPECIPVEEHATSAR